MRFATGSNPADPAIRSHSAPAKPAHFRETLAAKLDDYQVCLLEEFSNEPEAFLRFARSAVNEAASLAWSTPYAHLFLPALAEEKTQYARQWASRQCRVGSGRAAVSTTASHEVIHGNELAGIHQQATLATGRVSRSSEAASRAFEAAR